MKLATACALLLALGWADPVRAQVTGSNLLEAQGGNFPDFEPKNRWDLYDQLSLDYMFSSGRVGIRYEFNENSEDLYTYQELTQRYAEITGGDYRLRIGNLYTILGRGLVHRSFELPGVVLDQPGIRSRYGPSRDVDGALLEGRAGPVGLRAYGGKPNSGEVSPASEPAGGTAPYNGQLIGGEVNLDVWRRSRVGATYTRASAGGRQPEYASGFAEADPMALLDQDLFALPIYFEFAQGNGSLADWWELNRPEDGAYAMYVASNLLWESFALSAEWKDYRNFRLGFNDPPSLVREHTFPLLNRNTHVLNAEREAGYQFEGSWTWPAWGTLTANRSLANLANSVGTWQQFEETYVEAHVAPGYGEVWEVTGFWDTGKDESDFITGRDVYGGTATVRFLERWSVTADVEKQDATRRFFTLPPESFADLYTSAGVSRAEWGSASFVWERSTDPQQEALDDLSTPGIQPRNWYAFVVNAVLSQQHQATLFVGQRRGGRACTAGTCYEVSPFEGVELRFLTRF